MTQSNVSITGLPLSKENERLTGGGIYRFMTESLNLVKLKVKPDMSK